MKQECISLMDRSKFIDEFDKSRAGHEMLVLFCSCEIHYSGRAEAHLPKGDRLIVIKQDGVFLIHQPEKGNPINYLKSGAELRLEKFEGHLLLKGKYTPNKEFLDVEIFKIYDVMRRRLEDGQKQILQGNEADMSDAIRDDPKLISDDFKPVSREEQTKVGYVDVFGHDGNGNLVVIECKRYTAGLSAVSQLHRYVEKIKSVKGTEQVKGIMACPKITANAEEMLKGYGYEWKLVKPPLRHARHDKKQQSLSTFE
jgi:RecB family endonuclease NucS